jgi:hypothetical protein
MLAMSMADGVLAQKKRAAAKGSGPSLEATLKFIADKLTQQGAVNFAGYVHDKANGNDWIVRQSAEVSNVRTDPEACRLTFHWKFTSNGDTASDGEFLIPLGKVENVEIVPEEQAWKRVDSKMGNTTWSYKADPPVFVVRINRADGISNEFNFYDEYLANRVAKAVVHATELCVGSEKEPF